MPTSSCWFTFLLHQFRFPRAINKLWIQPRCVWGWHAFLLCHWAQTIAPAIINRKFQFTQVTTVNNFTDDDTLHEWKLLFDWIIARVARWVSVTQGKLVSFSSWAEFFEFLSLNENGSMNHRRRETSLILRSLIAAICQTWWNPPVRYLREPQREPSGRNRELRQLSSSYRNVQDETHEHRQPSSSRLDSRFEERSLQDWNWYLNKFC